MFGLANIMMSIAMELWAPNAQFDTKTGRILGIDSLDNYVLQNLSFVFLLACLFLSIRFEHKRPFMSLITPNRSIDWKKMLKSFGVFLGLMIAESCVGFLLDPADIQLSFKFDRFFMFAAVALFLTPIQTATEELLFRGYLLQMTALLTRNRYTLVLASGLVFGLLHLPNPELANGGWPLAVYYCLVGCFLAAVTLKSNGLEVAIGIHAATNLFCALIVNYPNSALETESIFHTLTGPDGGALLSFSVQAIIFYLIMFGGKGARQSITSVFSRNCSSEVPS